MYIQNQEKQQKYSVQKPNEHVSQNTNVVHNCKWCADAICFKSNWFYATELDEKVKETEKFMWFWVNLISLYTALIATSIKQKKIA